MISLVSRKIIEEVVTISTSSSWSFASSFNWFSCFFCLIRASLTIQSLRALIWSCIMLHECMWRSADIAWSLTVWSWTNSWNRTKPFTPSTVDAAVVAVACTLPVWSWSKSGGSTGPFRLWNAFLACKKPLCIMT